MYNSPKKTLLEWWSRYYRVKHITWGEHTQNYPYNLSWQLDINWKCPQKCHYSVLLFNCHYLIVDYLDFNITTKQCDNFKGLWKFILITCLIQIFYFFLICDCQLLMPWKKFLILKSASIYAELLIWMVLGESTLDSILYYKA